MKILHVTFMFPSEARPNHGIAVGNIVNGIANQVNDVQQTVVHISYKEADNFEGAHLAYPGVKYLRAHLPSFFKLFPFFRSGLVEQLLGTEQYDLIHFHNVFPGLFLFRRYVFKHKTPYIITFRGSCLRAIQFTFFKSILLKLISGAKSFIFLSDFYRQKIGSELNKQQFNFPKDRVHLIPNFKPDSWHSNTITNVPGKVFKLLLIANIETRKNIMNTVKAVNLAMKSNPITLDIYGDMLDQSIYKELTQKPGFGSSIKYHPSINNDKLREIIDAHDGVILLAHQETFGMAYIEAILRNRPIIYSANAGISAFVQDMKCGLAVQDVTNIAEIAEAIKHCIQNYHSFDFRDSRKFLEGRVIQTLADLYKQAM